MSNGITLGANTGVYVYLAAFSHKISETSSTPLNNTGTQTMNNNKYVYICIVYHTGYIQHVRMYRCIYSTIILYWLYIMLVLHTLLLAIVCRSYIVTSLMMSSSSSDFNSLRAISEKESSSLQTRFRVQTKLQKSDGEDCNATTTTE